MRTMEKRKKDRNKRGTRQETIESAPQSKQARTIKTQSKHNQKQNRKERGKKKERKKKEERTGQ